MSHASRGQRWHRQSKRTCNVLRLCLFSALFGPICRLHDSGRRCCFVIRFDGAMTTTSGAEEMAAASHECHTRQFFWRMTLLAPVPLLSDVAVVAVSDFVRSAAKQLGRTFQTSAHWLMGRLSIINNNNIKRATTESTRAPFSSFSSGRMMEQGKKSAEQRNTRHTPQR
jgi:hypothetical protein